jgi:hypothetical protein
MRRPLLTLAACLSIFGFLAPSSYAQSDNEVVAGIAAKAKAQFQDAKGKEKRYTGQHCDAVGSTSPYWSSILPEYKGLPVQDCSPLRSYNSSDGGTEISVDSRALVLLPTAQMMADVIVNACKANGFSGDALKTCADKTYKYVIGSNGAQFIVSGLITEPKKEGYSQEGTGEWTNPTCKKTAEEDVLYSFRDGVTVRLKGQSRSSWRSGENEGCKAMPQPSQKDFERYLTTEPESVKNHGRIADLHRDIYAACAGVKKLSDNEWRSLVRSNFIHAWKTGDDKLLTTWVRASLKPSAGCKL